MATINLKSFPLTEDAVCPKCKQETKLYDPNGSEFYVCKSCHSLLRFISHDQAEIEKSSKKPLADPIIPMGSEGTINGFDFKVIAYLEKKEGDSRYRWREYILYNYEKGYATLSEYDGHWNFVAGKEFYPALEFVANNAWGFVTYEDITYPLFHKYTATVTALAGEFDWNPLSEQIKTSEFIAPPFIIYREQSKKGSIPDHYLGEYLEAKTIATAFKLNENLFPEAIGIGANQFSEHYARWQNVWRLTAFAVLILLGLQFLSIILRPEHIVVNENFSISKDSTSVSDFRPFTTKTFNIDDQSSAVEFEISSEVDNNWLETNIVLVNEKTNETWEVTEGVEYYSGNEGGESWTEGSKTTTVLLSSIPKGSYHLNVYPAAGDPATKNIFIRVSTNVTTWLNLLIACFALCLYPIYCWFRKTSFEKQRWLNSNYSPYET